MALLPPIVIDIRHVQELIQYVLEQHASPSTLIVCSSKADFFDALRPADIDESVDQACPEDEEPMAGVSAASQVKHFAPTLRLLSTSRSVKLAFCPDITHLRAYLACVPSNSSSGPTSQHESDEAPRKPGAVPMLAIFNPIELHRPTSAFSAQGLNRTLSIAVEAAHRSGRKLILAESVFEAWNEELSILNVTNKRLGELAVGRTVTAKAVAERWCSFQTLASPNP